MTRRETPARHRPLRSYILRLVELRSTDVRVVYELIEIGGGPPQRFASTEALRRFLDNAGAGPSNATPTSAEESQPPGA